nr:DUF6049 family protein [Arsenicicoccus dermatophilus]
MAAPRRRPVIRGARGAAARLAAALTTLVPLLGGMPTAAAAPSRGAASPHEAVPSVAPSAASARPGSVTAAPQVRRTAARVSITLDDVTPVVARPGEEVKVRFTVAAPAATGPLSARLLVGDTPVTGRAVLDSWLHATTPRPLTSREVAQGRIPPLAARGTSTLTLAIPATAVPRGRPFGAYPLAVEVRSGTTRAGVLRSVLPGLRATPEYEPLRLAWIAPITLPADPELTAGTAAQVGAAWSRAVGPQGPLQQRLDAAAGTPVTWLVDPSVLAPPSRPGGLITDPTAVPSLPPTPTRTRTTSTPAGTSPPHPLVGATGRPPAGSHPTPTPSPTTSAPANPGSGASALAGAARDAQQLAARLRALDDTQPLWALPPGDPDTAALLAGDPRSLRPLLWPQQASPLDSAVGRSVPDSVAWPADGLWPDGRTASWQAATARTAPAAALVSTSAIRSSPDLTPGAGQRSSEGLPLLAYDERLSLVTSGRRTRTDAELVQEFLGQSLTLLGERPGTRRTTLVAVPRDAALSPAALRRLWRATRAVPWLRQVDASTFLSAGSRATAPSRLRPAAASPLTPQTTQELAEGARAVTGLRKILPGEERLTTSWTTALRDLASARWRGRPQEWEGLRHTLEESVDEVRRGVQVPPSTFNFLADTGVIQITVTNSLPYAVHDLRLDLVPGIGTLRVDKAPPPLSIAAGSRTTTRVQVSARAAGTVPLEARLTTPDGVVLGSPSTVNMNVRPTSAWVFALIAGIVGGILVLGLARALRRGGPTRAERELGDHDAVAEAVLGADSSPKDP